MLFVTSTIFQLYQVIDREYQGTGYKNHKNETITSKLSLTCNKDTSFLFYIWFSGYILELFRQYGILYVSFYSDNDHDGTIISLYIFNKIKSKQTEQKYRTTQTFLIRKVKLLLPVDNQIFSIK